MTAARLGGLRRDDRASRALALAVDRLARRIPALRPLRRTLERVTRYVGVGVASSLFYAGAVAAAASGLGIAPVAASLIGYALTIPLNFLLHRHFTFRSADQVQRDVLRYAFAQALGMVMSYAIMALTVGAFRLPYGFGILGAVVLVPVASYLLMDRWVFALRADR